MVKTEEMAKYGIPHVRIVTPSIAETDPEWKEWINKEFWSCNQMQNKVKFIREMNMSPKACEDMLHLHKILLKIGGEETLFPTYEEDIVKILGRGRYYPGKSKMMKGRPSQCHANSAELWERNHAENDVRIATGYALSDDGLWRQHSWIVHRYETKTQHRMRIIETTAKRLAYFGFEMNDDEAYEFVDNNF